VVYTLVVDGVESAGALDYHISDLDARSTFTFNAHGQMMLIAPVDRETRDTYRFQVVVGETSSSKVEWSKG
jgi:hypothetical protein